MPVCTRHYIFIQKIPIIYTNHKTQCHHQPLHSDPHCSPKETSVVFTWIQNRVRLYCTKFSMRLHTLPNNAVSAKKFNCNNLLLGGANMYQKYVKMLEYLHYIGGGAFYVGAHSHLQWNKRPVTRYTIICQCTTQHSLCYTFTVL